jgi:hypothetical protein
VDKHFPQISEAIAAEAGSRDMKVLVDKKTGGSVSASATFDWKMLAPTSPMPSQGTTLEGAVVEATTTETLSPNVAVPDLNPAFSNAPITPEAGGNWKLFRLLLVLAILGVVVYFVLHRG